ncbi:MAG: CNNM domain-containing protein [Ruminococcus sp.]
MTNSLQLILIALNAIFACAEIAVISSNETRIDKLAEQGSKPAKRLQALQNRPAQFLQPFSCHYAFRLFGSAFAADHFSEAPVQLLVSWGVAIPQATLQTISVVLITILLSS